MLTRLSESPTRWVKILCVVVREGTPRFFLGCICHRTLHFLPHLKQTSAPLSTLIARIQRGPPSLAILEVILYPTSQECCVKPPRASVFPPRTSTPLSYMHCLGFARNIMVVVSYTAYCVPEGKHILHNEYATLHVQYYVCSPIFCPAWWSWMIIPLVGGIKVLVV